MTNIQTKIRKSDFLFIGRMTFSLSSGWLPLISSRFFLLLAWLIAPWTHQERSCLPLFTNNMLLDSYVGNLFTPHCWEQLSTLLWMCGLICWDLARECHPFFFRGCSFAVHQRNKDKLKNGSSPHSPPLALLRRQAVAKRRRHTKSSYPGRSKHLADHTPWVTGIPAFLTPSSWTMLNVRDFQQASFTAAPYRFRSCRLERASP